MVGTGQLICKGGHQSRHARLGRRGRCARAAQRPVSRSFGRKRPGQASNYFRGGHRRRSLPLSRRLRLQPRAQDLRAAQRYW